MLPLYRLLSTCAGLQIDFMFNMYGGSGGSGLTVFLRKYSSSSRVLGSRASLGYGPDRAASPVQGGLPDAMVGE